MASFTFIKTSVALFVLSCYATSANAFFRMGADVLLAARMDPIVSPGAVSQHMHNIVGGNNFAASYDYDDLRKSSCTTVPISVDLSNYWAPGLVYVNKTDNSFTRIPSYYFIYYLQRRGSNQNLKIQQWPKGFKMVAGNPNRRAYNATNNADKAVSFLCLDYSGKVSTGDMEKFIPHNCPDGMRAQVVFPSCWDGVNVDSPDHKSHVSYPIQAADNGDCPASHPVRLPTLFYEQVFAVGEFPYNGDGTWALTNGDTTGYGYHGDFQNGWDASPNSVLQQALDQCNANSGLLEDCPPLKPFIDDASKKACRPNPLIPDEDVGYRTGNDKNQGRTPTIPGCNPLWTGTGPKPTCPNPVPNPPFVKPTSVLPAGWTEKGCITESTSGRALKGASWTDKTGMDKAKCAAFCESKGFKLAGVEWAQECYCDNALQGDAKETNSKECGMQCEGNSFENCGGSKRLTLLTKTGASTPPTTSVSSAKPTSTSAATKPIQTSAVTQPITSSAATKPITTPAATKPITSAVTQPITSAKPSTTAAPASNWVSRGCMSEPSTTQRALSGAMKGDSKGMTADVCKAFCQSKGFTIAGVEYGIECWCGNQLANGTKAADASKCHIACSGKPSEKCGGDWHLNVFSLTKPKTRRSRRGHHAHGKLSELEGEML